ncbi:hypothetical protein [Dactylosporangium sp. CA-233914]|uniref:hypothetical protein n=1 Tax=Dactylosporangium sp. CA-233914 TaxID=3239934 RepID=UPI003D8BC41B
MLQRVGGALKASVLWVVMPAVVALGTPAVAFGSPVLTSPVLQKAPSPTPSSSSAANPNLGPSLPGVAACTISDPQVTEVSGLVVTADGYAVINDSNVERSREKIFFLDRECRLTRSVGYPSSAFDPEDLAVAKDGTLWVADVGDNTTLTGGSGNRRSSIALWSLAPGANTPVIHRLAYPDGRARDAEALIIDGDGHPVIITKDPVGEVYTFTQPLPANNASPASLTRAGTFKPQATGTANPYGIVGTAVVTGAAISPDGKRAVVRTMSDAYEFDVTNGDVVTAITEGTARITPLPNEPQGEGIAYSRDGTEFLTTSDQPKTSTILRYTPYSPPAAPSAAPSVQAQAPKAKDRSFLDSLSLQDLTRIVIGIGLFGVLMIIVGVVAVIRSRRRRRALLAGASTAPAGAAGAESPEDDDQVPSLSEPTSADADAASPEGDAASSPGEQGNEPGAVDGLSSAGDPQQSNNAASVEASSPAETESTGTERPAAGEPPAETGSASGRPAPAAGTSAPAKAENDVNPETDANPKSSAEPGADGEPEATADSDSDSDAEAGAAPTGALATASSKAATAGRPAKSTKSTRSPRTRRKPGAS